jgi:hypothetical protein
MEPERDAQEELSSMASSATKMANEPEGTEEELPPDVQDVLFSALASSVCYWITIFLLAIVGEYLIQWWLTHPGPYAAPANDPWGITTPPWLVLPLAPIGVVGSLGHAVWCALRGQQAWKMLITAATLVAVMGCSKLLEFYLAPM